MLPSFHPHSPYPERFYLPSAPTHARLLPCKPSFLRDSGRTPRKLAGLRYERFVQRHLHANYPASTLTDVWLRYTDRGREHFAQIDALMIDGASSRLHLIEIKLSHTSFAWTQLLDKYYPLLSQLFPTHLWRYGFTEICQVYDPHRDTSARRYSTRLTETLPEALAGPRTILQLSP
jgi:hypothetical protein